MSSRSHNTTSKHAALLAYPLIPAATHHHGQPPPPPRIQTKNSPNVEFCGYSIPHPTESVVNLRVQTTGGATSAAAVRQACGDLKQACQHVDAVFAKAVEQFKADNPQPME